MHEAQRLPLRIGARVRVVEALGDVSSDAQAIGPRQRVRLRVRVAQDVEDDAPLEVLHGDVVVALELAELVDGDDVAVREQDCDLRLLDEHLHELRIARIAREDALDDHVLFKAGRTKDLRAIHLGHAAGRNQVREQILAKRRGELRC